MARILIAAYGMPSLVYPCLEAARRLKEDDHEIVFIGPEDLPEDEKEFVEAARRAKPDLILLNGEMHEQILAVSRLEIPIALLSTFVSIWRLPGVPPPSTPVIPGVGWKGSRAGIALHWLALRWWKIRKARRNPRLAVLRDIARDAGFDLGRTDAGQWLFPWTYRDLPVLSMHALEFEFPHRPLENVHYVGPLISKTREDRPLSREDRERLDRLYAGRAEGRRLICAAFGSVFTTDGDFLGRLLRSIEERPTWDLIISRSGRGTDDGGLPGEELPERVHSFSWLPQLEVLNHVDAMVTHGGVNTVDECVLAGVPLLIYCGGETEMAGVTARVVYHGIGLAGDHGDDPATIREHLERLFEDDAFLERGAVLRRAYEAYAEQKTLERVVRDLLADGS